MADVKIKLVNEDPEKPAFGLVEKIRREVHELIERRKANRNN